MGGRSSGSNGAGQLAAHVASLGPSATRGRLAVLTCLRAAVPLMVLLALAASPATGSRPRIAALLTAQTAFGFASLAFAARQRPAMVRLAVWSSVLVDLCVVGGLVWTTGGAASPLVFLFAVEALAVGITLSAGAGLRVLGLVLATYAVLHSLQPPQASRALGEIVATMIVAGAGIALVAVVQREGRRRAVELASIRRIALDIQDSLSLDEILADLCRGVVNDLRFTSAAVLLPASEGQLECRGSCGVRGSTAGPFELRGTLATAMDGGRVMIVPSAQARAENQLVDLLGRRGYIALPMGTEGLLVVTRAPRRHGILRRRSGRVRANELEPLMSLAQQAALTVANARLHAHVAAMAVTDPLTDLANHREFQRVLTHECDRARRYRDAGHRPSALIIDIDRFKAVNDRFGHQAGDEVLRSVARTLRGAVRSFDLVARYGGEEFGVVLPETDEEGADRVAERARTAVRDLGIEVDGRRLKITVSIGVATAPDDGMTPAQLIAAADAALYRSKATGRNRVTHARSLGRRVPSIARRRGRAAS